MINFESPPPKFLRRPPSDKPVPEVHNQFGMGLLKETFPNSDSQSVRFRTPESELELRYLIYYPTSRILGVLIRKCFRIKTLFISHIVFNLFLGSRYYRSGIRRNESQYVVGYWGGGLVGGVAITRNLCRRTKCHAAKLEPIYTVIYCQLQIHVLSDLAFWYSDLCFYVNESEFRLCDCLLIQTRSPKSDTQWVRIRKRLF
jgi:hypothetical protein